MPEEREEDGTLTTNPSLKLPRCPFQRGEVILSIGELKIKFILSSENKKVKGSKEERREYREGNRLKEVDSERKVKKREGN